MNGKSKKRHEERGDIDNNVHGPRFKRKKREDLQARRNWRSRDNPTWGQWKGISPARGKKSEVARTKRPP